MFGLFMAVSCWRTVWAAPGTARLMQVKVCARSAADRWGPACGAHRHPTSHPC